MISFSYHINCIINQECLEILRKKCLNFPSGFVIKCLQGGQFIRSLICALQLVNQDEGCYASELLFSYGLTYVRSLKVVRIIRLDILTKTCAYWTLLSFQIFPIWTIWTFFSRWHIACDLHPMSAWKVLNWALFYGKEFLLHLLWHPILHHTTSLPLPPPLLYTLFLLLQFSGYFSSFTSISFYFFLPVVTHIRIGCLTIETTTIITIIFIMFDL